MTALLYRFVTPPYSRGERDEVLIQEIYQQRLKGGVRERSGKHGHGLVACHLDGRGEGRTERTGGGVVETIGGSDGVDGVCRGDVGGLVFGGGAQRDEMSGSHGNFLA